jgi:pilus assembly protein CpaE
VIVIIDPSPDVRDQLAARIHHEEEVVRAGTLAEAETTLQHVRRDVRLVVLGPGLATSEVLSFAEKVDHQREGVGTLLVAETLETGLLREALRAGVSDVLTLNATTDEWDEAIQRARARIAAEHDLADGGEAARGRVVSVFSTKGGSGKSLVASNLAVIAAQRSGQRVALVDLDLQSGDLAIMFQLMPALSIYDAAQGADRLDEEALHGYMTAHRSGVDLLAAPMEPSLAEQVDAPAIDAILELLPTMYALTVIDGPPMFTDQMLTALDRSDEIVLIGSMDVPSIKNLKLAISTMSQLGHPREKLRIVLNRADSKVGLRTSEVEKSLGVEIDVSIPSSRDVPLSINQGEPLAASRSRSPVVHAIGQLAAAIAPEMMQGDGRRSRSRRR